MEGIPVLKEGIEGEWAIRMGLLAASEFSKYFSTSLQDLLKKDDEYLKQWLQVI